MPCQSIFVTDIFGRKAAELPPPVCAGGPRLLMNSILVSAFIKLCAAGLCTSFDTAEGVYFEAKLTVKPWSVLLIVALTVERNKWCLLRWDTTRLFTSLWLHITFYWFNLAELKSITSPAAKSAIKNKGKKSSRSKTFFIEGRSVRT